MMKRSPALIKPSEEACKNFVCNVLPKIMLDLQREGKLPPEYMTGTKEKGAG